MRNYLQPMLLLLCLLPGILDADWRPREMKVKLELNEPTDLDKLRSLGISPVSETLPTVYLHLIPTELNQLRELGFRPKILIPSLANHSSDLLKQPHLADYRDYEAIHTRLYELQEEYRSIMRVSVIGKSVSGRDIFAVKISDNPTLAEDEPKIAFDGGFHGDEINTSEILLKFIEDLCESSKADGRIRELIYSREIYILPLVNPDGRNTLTRRNANNVDLNRDWGYFWDGSGNSRHPYSQPESHALLKWMILKSPSIHQSLHSGAKLISYPWSFHPESVPEADLFEYLSSGYATSSGYDNLMLGSGYNQLYPICGTAKDSYYGINGSLAWTMEIGHEKAPPYTQTAEQYEKNKPSFIYLLQQAGHGISGSIRDAISKKIVQARVSISSDQREYWPLYTSNGYFHKFLLQGTYTLRIEANGYKTSIIPEISVQDSGAMKLDIALRPGGNNYAFRIIATHRTEKNTPLRSKPFRALGEPDRNSYAIGRNGWIILDMGKEVKDYPGADLRIYEGGRMPESCYLLASSDPAGPWSTIGKISGTADIDLSESNINSFRYLRIEDDGDGFTGITDNGFKLDAVETRLIPANSAYLTATNYTVLDTLNNFNGILETGETAGLRILIENPGSVTSRPGIAKLNAAKSGLTVLEGFSKIPSLAPGASAWCDGFRLKNDLERENSLEALEVLLQTDDGKEWEHPFIIKVSRGARLSLVQKALSFDSVFVQTQTEKQLTFQNTGGDTLKIFRLRSSSALFYPTPYQLIIPPGEDATCSVSFRPTYSGNERDTLEILSNDPVAPQQIVLLEGRGIDAPALALQTDSLFINRLPADSSGLLLGMRNTGAGGLHYRAYVQSSKFDLSGYTRHTSDEPGSRRFNWRELDESKSVSASVDQPLTPLPFDFPFYNTLYRFFRINKNGELELAKEKGEASAIVFSSPDGRLLNATSDEISYSTYTDKLIIQWKELSSSSTSATYQMEIDTDGRITYHFLELNDLSQNSFVKLSGYHNEEYLLFKFLESSVSNLSVTWTPNFNIRLTGMEKTLSENESSSIQLNLSRFTSPERSRVYLVIETNDPLKPLTRIPVDIHPSGHSSSAKTTKSNVAQVQLEQNFPNPFNPQTTISFRLPETMQVNLVVYNTLGQVIQMLVDESLSAGEYRIPWKAINEYGQRLPSGIYFYELKAGEFSEIRKMILLH